MTQNRWWTLVAVLAVGLMGWGVWASSKEPVQPAAAANVPAISPVASPPKQHFRFTFEIEYKGDGIEADVAKAALGGKTSDNKVDLSEITQLLEKLLEAATGQKVKTTGAFPISVPPRAIPACPATIMPEESKKLEKEPANTAEATDEAGNECDRY